MAVWEGYRMTTRNWEKHLEVFGKTSRSFLKIFRSFKKTSKCFLSGIPPFGTKCRFSDKKNTFLGLVLYCHLNCADNTRKTCVWIILHLIIPIVPAQIRPQFSLSRSEFSAQFPGAMHGFGV
jgi:hypothetical protein